MAIWDVSGVASSGSWDPAALLLAGPSQVKHLFVEGRQVINNGEVTTLDLPRLLERHHRLAQALMLAG